MSFQKNQRVKEARAVVIKENSAGESNKRLTLLAKGIGKMTVSARGAKNQKSKFLSCAQVFCYGDFVFYDGGDFLAVTQMDLIRNFSVYYDDIFKLTYGSYFLELIDKTVMLSQESDDIMRLLIKSLHMLEKTDNPQRISAAFQIKLFSLLGFCPDTQCGICGGINEPLYYSQAAFSKGDGFFCNSCRKTIKTPCSCASEGLLAAIAYIKSSDNANTFNFIITEQVLNELHSVAEMIVKSQVDMELNSLEIIKRL